MLPKPLENFNPSRIGKYHMNDTIKAIVKSCSI